MTRSKQENSGKAHSVEAVAGWMVTQLKEKNYLSQEEAVYEIGEEFGDAFTYDNESGNLAIGRDVLAAFRKLTVDDVVWDRSDRAWRWREPTDAPGRQQD